MEGQRKVTSSVAMMKSASTPFRNLDQLLTRYFKGQVRTLQFDRDHQRLYFATTLQHAVQAFSLQDGRLLNSAAQHPSPPTTFAVSCTSEVLVSASARPPTLYLSNLLPGGVPLLLQPTCSTTAVVAAKFHPERESFALAFEDGSIAACDVTRLRRGLEPAQSLQSWDMGEIAHITNLHQTAADNRYGLTGIAQVAFVPGLECTAVTVGSDAKCYVVNFKRRGLAVVSRSWHVPVSATALAISGTSTAALVATGLSNGVVFLYTIDGKPVAKHCFGATVIGVEWVLTESGAENVDPPSQTFPDIVVSKASRRASSFQGRGSRRVASIKRVRARPPSIPPRPVPKEGGKLAQRRAEEAMSGSESPERSAWVTSEPETRGKGKKIIVRSHGKARSTKSGPTGSSSQSFTHPPLPRSQDTVPDGHFQKTQPQQPLRITASRSSIGSGEQRLPSSLAPESHDTVLDWAASSEDLEKLSTAISIKFPALIGGSTATNATPMFSSDHGQQQPMPLPLRISQKLPPPPSTIQSVRVTPGGSRSIMTSPSESTGTVIDWAPCASQSHQPRPFRMRSTAQIRTDSTRDDSSFISQKRDAAIARNTKTSSKDFDQAAISRPSNSSMSAAVKQAARPRGATAATNWSSLHSGLESAALTPMLLRTVFEDEFALFQTRIMLELRDQREWMQSFMLGRVTALEEENELLWEELERLQRSDKGNDVGV